MNAFLSVLEKHNVQKSLTRGRLTTLQVNMGNLCNQSCEHCHIGASPSGTRIMAKEVIDDILGFLARHSIVTLDITGGAPELNPHFEYFVSNARPLVDELIVRSNLTVLLEGARRHLVTFYKDKRVHLICSLPCYLKQNVDRQRGGGVFDKSVEALKALNSAGFAKDGALALDLVYNPTGATLPPQQSTLEQEYKKKLKSGYGIEFNRLITITNVPINKFKHYLQKNGQYERYYDLLEQNFNPGVMDNLMCRTFVSVGYDGRLYDCDFNQALDLALKDERGRPLRISGLDPATLEDKKIIIDKHCLSCTAGSGSGCQGALASEADSGSGGMSVLKETVKEYYGKIIATKNDLKTSACCSLDSVPARQRAIFTRIAPEILNKFYGCGSPIPPVLENTTVLDLGCGTGRDVYLASYLVGPSGHVVGIDMTDEQLSVARKYIGQQTKEFGFTRPNVEFKKAYIEDLKSASIADGSVDVVISNCVINLSPDKRSVFSEIFRILKPGGELYFSDVFAGCRVPERIKKDPVFYGECLGGAMYIEDFRRMLRETGCPDYRLISQRRISLNDEKMRNLAGSIEFYSMTVRAFKLPGLLEDICEDYGQVATYLGTIDGQPHEFVLDDHHVFIAGKPVLVCGNTAAMLTRTRYSKHFKVEGNRSVHFGPFNCAPAWSKKDTSSAGGSCC